MERRTLGLILAVTPFIAVIIAIAIAFALTGDINAVILEKDPGEAISGYLNGFTGEGEQMLEVSGYSYSNENGTIVLNVKVNNPIDHPILIRNMSYPVEINGQTVILTLDRPIEAMPENSSDIMLEGILPGDLIPSGPPDNPAPSDIDSEFSFAGIIIKNKGGAQ